MAHATANPLATARRSANASAPHRVRRTSEEDDMANVPLIRDLALIVAAIVYVIQNV